jgi:hypothetical protein
MILLRTGFGLLITNWIMSCINSASIAILINGGPSPFFQSGRGLRQGLPFIPSYVYSSHGRSQPVTKEGTDGRKNIWRQDLLDSTRFSIYFLWMTF